MSVVPPLPLFRDGVLTTSQLNQLSDVLRYLLIPPLAKLLQTSAQSLATGVSTAIQMNSEIYDGDVDGLGGHDNATDNTRFTATYRGWYELIGGSISFNNSGVGVRLGFWAVNGSAVHGGLTESASAGAGTITSIPIPGNLVYLNAGDYAEMMGFQNSGGALLTVVSSTDKSNWSIKWVSS